MKTRVVLGDTSVEVVRKNIKNIHLSVHPPTGRVTISAPARLNLDTIRVFASSKLGWIRKQQTKILSQEREPPREYIDRESHYAWGRRYLLQVVEANQTPAVELNHHRMRLYVRPGSPQEKRKAVLEAWYREQLKSALPPLIAKWEVLMGVKVKRWYVQRMKTRWGSCNTRAHTIRLNTDLARKPRECLEYVVVHEMVHLLEPNHNARFVALMTQYIPKWQAIRQVLNSLPVRHDHWEY